MKRDRRNVDWARGKSGAIVEPTLRRVDAAEQFANAAFTAIRALQEQVAAANRRADALEAELAQYDPDGASFTGEEWTP
jgi:glutathione S-transferase